MENFRFVDGRFEHQGFLCACGKEHRIPIQEIIVKRGALAEVGEALNRLDLGKKCVVIADLNTYDAAGARVMDALHDAAYEPTLCLFQTRELVKPNEQAIGTVMLNIELDTDFLLVAGSGSLTDLTRFISSRTGIPFVSVPTAASMDGYASTGAPMLQDGYKRTIISTYPHGIIADVDVICQAPYEMTMAGFGDMIGKLNSRVDWQLSHILNGEYYCEYFVDLVDSVAQMCVNNADKIKERDPEIMARLVEGLILSGIAMLAIGTSRPASGAEHMLSHYWEMKAFLEKRPQHFHGAKVGVGTGVMAKFYEKFFARNPAEIDLDDVNARKVPLETLEASIRQGLGSIGEGIVDEVTRPLYLSWEEQQQQIRLIQDAWDKITPLKDIEPSFEHVLQVQRAVGAKVMPKEIDVTPALLKEAILYAKEVRSKYTILRTADALGWLEEITDEIVSEYEKENMV